MTKAEAAPVSPFLHCDEVAQDNQLAILHLKRDILTPTLLHALDADDEGYDEGKVTNTRFGSFPHSTLIGAPWGSQVRASAVDTGSRGRRDLKRKRDGSTDAIVKEEDIDAGTRAKGQKRAVEARTGFVHLLPPTPEKWTTSLPHRTQVVYTPDYSYVLHRIKARPGTRIIEAGAGSGSFTHAAARAVFNGYPSATSATPNPSLGKVFSFEFHAPRAEKLAGELDSHGLNGIVELTARDVCNDGFVPSSSSSSSLSSPGDSVNATAIFLDLPAPWLALKHLTRSSSSSFSPLHPGAAVHLCTFSPCIEQVQRTITTLRQLGWVEIEMVELSARRIEVRRERVGIAEQGQRGVNDSPATVEESLVRLREQECRQGVYHAATALPAAAASTFGIGGPTGATRTTDAGIENGSTMEQDVNTKSRENPKAPQRPHTRLPDDERKLFKEGKLVTRSEPELRTHTSYLVFAVLPRAWSDDDERKAREMWRGDVQVQEPGFGKGISRRGRKKAERQRREEREEKEREMETERERQEEEEAKGKGKGDDDVP